MQQDFGGAREADMLARLLHTVRCMVPAILAIEVSVQDNRRYARPSARRPRPGERIEVVRRVFASVDHHRAPKPLAIEQAVLAGQARAGDVQDGVENTSCVARRHRARQDYRQTHDPTVLMRRTGERQRR